MGSRSRGPRTSVECVSPGSAVALSLGAGASRTVSAQELENGEGVSGGLGTGQGKWRLAVSADQPIEVMSLLSGPTGHLTNLSTAPSRAVDTQTAADVFRAHISGPVVQSRCIHCHVEGGRSGHTRLVFEPSTNPEHEALNLRTFERFISEVEDGVDRILNKIQGVGHGGGVQVAADTPEFAHMQRFLRLLDEEVSSAPITVRTLFDTVRMAPAHKVLRRAALIFAGRTPTDEEDAAAQSGGAALRSTIRALMTGPQFHEFLIRAANDRLLTDRNSGIIDHHADFLVAFSNEAYRCAVVANEGDDDRLAGAFQNYGDDGWYKDKWGGADSLDEFYKSEGGASLPVRADSWENRETLSWRASLGAGVETIRVVFVNDFDDEATGDDGMIYLDRLSVADANGRALASHEFETLGPPIAPWGPCGETRSNSVTGRVDHLVMWIGHLSCGFYIDVNVPSNGVYNVDVIAWADHHEQYEADGFAKLSVVAHKYAYQEGDTWYRDMRTPGFAGELAPDSDNSVQWLAEKIVADERFAEATVKFWWPAIMGSEVAEPPEDKEDADFEGLLLAANAQGAGVARLAAEFRRGFRGGAVYNLKDLLAEIVLSEWFRADAVEDANPVRLVALRDAGARRMLTPEELAHKTTAVTGFQWGRHIRANCYPTCERVPNALTDDYRLLYGGIDSDGVTERARDITTVMAGVAKRHAAVVSCPVVMRELYLVPESERNLFSGIDKYVTPRSTRGADAIRNKLVELHDKLLGVQVTPHSPDVEAAYGLFVDVSKLKRKPWEYNFRDSDCYWNWLEDLSFFEGILEDAVVEEGETGGGGKKVVLRLRSTSRRSLHGRHRLVGPALRRAGLGGGARVPVDGLPVPVFVGVAAP